MRGMDVTDAELVGRFQRGDREAFARLTARWQDRAYARAYRLTVDADEADDITQSAMLRAYKGLAGFNGRSSFSTWLHRVVVNLCRDRQRAVKRRESTIRVVSESRRGGPQIAPPPDEAGERDDMGRTVALAVAALPEDMREAVVLKYYQGLKFVEVAEIVEAPISTVKSRLARGLVLLRETLENK